jgi:hypothetical protein
VNEVLVSKRTLLQGAASGFALSTDPQQRWLYMIDGANHHVWKGVVGRGQAPSPTTIVRRQLTWWPYVLMGQ